MFIDRKDGGLQLAHALEKYKNKGAVVLGIPRGGAETGYYVAKYLNAEFSLLIARKLGFPDNPEAAFGAIAEDGSTYLNSHALRYLPKETIEASIDIQKREIERRIKQLRQGKPLPDIKGKIVILVDDGIATGATICAAISMCRNLKAKKIVVAAPIAGLDTAMLLEEKADEVVILEKPEDYWAVSQGYEYFYNLEDKEVQEIMLRWEREKSKAASQANKK
ncbi:MAG TPA: phosphoribosyltransferase family protein [Chitinophagales bacterium]|nr:phosphoribosyltransferase family protein [Chitinophagales bacterium]